MIRKLHQGGMIIIILLPLIACTKKNFDQVSVTSPDKNIKVTISTKNQELFYQVEYGGNLVIKASRLGLLLKNEIGY